MKKLFFTLLAMALLLFSGYYGYLSYEEYEPVLKSDAQKKAVREMVIPEDDPDSPYDRVIDFGALKQINEDMAGWLYIPGTSIDYPILIGDTDAEYIHKDIEGDYSVVGCIFSYADTSRDMADARTVLFGHNMRQKTMFGELKRYLEEDFRSEHRKMYIYTEKKTMELELFSLFICQKTDDIFRDNPLPGTAEYQELLQNLSERNQYPDIGKEEIAGLYNNQAVSLVTCQGSAGTSDRLAVNAVAVREKYILN